MHRRLALPLLLALAACSDATPASPGGDGTPPGEGGGGTGGGCDRDGDGVDDVACGGTDCDDGDELVFPGAAERCGDGADDDCDGTPDDGCACATGASRPCYPLGDEHPTRGVGVCADGSQLCADEVWGDCTGATTPGDEGAACDDVDQDCDGPPDQALRNACGTCGPSPDEVCGNHLDDDCDGTIDDAELCNVSCAGVDPESPSPPELACCVAVTGDGRPPHPEPYGATCVEWPGLLPCDARLCEDLDGDPATACFRRAYDDDGDGATDRVLCGRNVGTPDPQPDAGCGFATPCALQDCDGRVNQPCYSGPPQTLGVGRCTGGRHSCEVDGQGDLAWTACAGEVTPVDELCGNGADDDCDGLVDEADGATGRACPGEACVPAEETCGDGLDGDCDGQVDDGCAPQSETQGCWSGPPAARGVGACRDGTQTSAGEFWGACEGQVLPAAERCDGAVDEDCDGQTDEGCCTPAPGGEVCNDADDDCDGLVDEGTLNACGTCPGTPCYEESFPGAEGWACAGCGLDGAGPGDPANPDALCGPTQLCLDRANFEQPYIWIARTGENTVQRINTRTFQSDFVTPSYGWSPSRTAVAVDGSVWVGHRGCQYQLSGCDGGNPEHGNAVHVATDGSLICRADVVGAANGIAVRAITLDGNDDVWIGSWDGAAIYQYSGSQVDASVSPPRCVQLRRVDLAWNGSPVRAYGAAVTAAGHLWIATLGSGPTLKVDVATGQIVDAVSLPYPSYGIAVDQRGNVWFGTWQGVGGAMRLDTATNTVTQVRPPVSWNGRDLGCEQGSLTRGVAVDVDGNVWNTNWSCDSISKYDPDGNHLGTFDVGNGPLGVAIDTDGQVWVVNYSGSSATVLDAQGNLVTEVQGLAEPYTYSDMTGLQLRLVTRQNGVWTTTYDAGHAAARWSRVEWTASSLPPGTSVCVRSRTAETRSALALAQYGRLLCSPTEFPMTPPAVAPLAGEVADGRFLQLEVQLQGANDQTPIVDGLEVFWERP